MFKQENVQLYFTQKFRNFATKSILKWRKIIEDWVILGDILVVHYEDVLQDKMKEIKRILKFLQVEPDERRMTCLKQSVVDMFKRKSKKISKSPFSSDLSDIIRQHIDHMDSLLHEFGHPGIPYNKYKIF